MQGLELGQGIFEKEKSLDVINSFKYDVILGAIHNLKDTPDFYYLDYSKYDVNKLLMDYFEAELALAEWNKTDVLAHLTYPLRYICGRDKYEIDLSKYNDVIRAIFETLIKNDKALEVNVSGLFGELGRTMPDVDLIQLYHDMGGQLITVGSDSHYYDKVCVGIDKGYDILRKCGYKEFTIFKNRTPMQIEIR